MKKLISVFIWLLFAVPCQARTIAVDDNGPADFNNIQATVNDSNDGDIIEVAPETYARQFTQSIDFMNKDIIIRPKDREDIYILSSVGGAPNAVQSNLTSGHNYVPSELIIKFKKTAAATSANWILEERRTHDLKLSNSLDELNEKYKVRNIEALFKDFKQNRQRVQNLLKKDKALLTKREKRILKRLKRAPKKATVPALDRIYKIKVDLEADQKLEEVVAAYRSNPDVEYAELNHIVSLYKSPNDPLYPLQWPLKNIGQDYPVSGRYKPAPGIPDCDVDAPEAWDKGTGISDIVVAVIDSGVDYTHRDLCNNMWVNEMELNGSAGVDDDGNGYIDDIYGYDFFNNNNDPNDAHGHGTHCAGVIAANGDNGLDTTGICWQARIMAVKFINWRGFGTVAGAAEAIYYAVENGADITSNSWGGEFDASLVREAIDYAHSQGVITVAAAGNDASEEPRYPAYNNHVIAVAATDSNDQKAVFSTYGDWVDIAAPGVDVLSLRAEDTSMGTIYDAFTTIASGTSMACPHVAGACALLLSFDTEMSAEHLCDTLMSTADPIASEVCASGRLNLCGAISRALGPKGTVWLDNDVYSCSGLIGIKLFDTDLNANGIQQITVSTDAGDLETVILVETDTVEGIFVGEILTDSGVPNIEDGTLQLSHLQVITATYNDVNDGTGKAAIVNDTAIADCQPPLIFNVEIDAPGPEPTVTLETDEPTTARVLYSQACNGPDFIVATDAILTTSHIIKLSEVSPETDYFFIVEASDAVDNETTDDNMARCYAFTTDRPGPIYVPGQYATIQEAIDRSWNSGTVWVSDGVHNGEGNRDIDFKGKIITVRSENGPHNCIIDCQGSESEHHRGFQFYNGETLGAVLDGFTIINGYAEYGAGILCIYTTPKITSCIIRGNTAEYSGGGVYGCDGVISNCIISANTAASYGGGLENCDGLIINCTILGNTAKNGGGIYNSDGLVTNCIIRANRPTYSIYHSSSTPLYSCLQDGSDGTGCIGSDPCFVEPGYWDANGTPDDTSDDFWVDGDYHLRPNSPCIDAGNYAYCLTLPCRSCDGSARLAGAQIDMGCYEADSEADADGDWLPDNSEPNYANEPDRDGDGILDGVELLRGTNPNVLDPLGQLDVPADANTIQEALFFSRCGERIVLAEGTYYENIHIGGRNLVLESANPNDWAVIDATIVNGNTDANCDSANGRTITFLGVETTNCQIRGITITGGHVSERGCSGLWGGGTLAQLTNCIISNNTAGYYGSTLEQFDGLIDNCVINGNKGSGLYNCDGVIRNCTISGNGKALFGGGVAWCDGEISNCFISNNTAQSGGGMGWCWSTVRNCVISGNSAAYYGGGILQCFGPVTNCLINGNSAEQNGGGIYNCEEIISNCTICGNFAGQNGGGISCQSLLDDSAPKLINSILWGNRASYGPQIALDTLLFLTPPTLAIFYTDIQGGKEQAHVDPNCTLIWGSGNLNEEPGFVSTGYWGASYDPNVAVEPNEPNAIWIDGDYHLLPESPCINTGDPNYLPEPDETDLDGKPRIIDDRIDMGAYEYRPTIPAEVRIVPRTINLANKGNWITCYIWLPGDYNVADIDTNSVVLDGEIKAKLLWVDEEEQLAMARIRRQELQSILEIGEVELTITGQLTDGTPFEAKDNIKVIDKGGGKPAN